MQQHHVGVLRVSLPDVALMWAARNVCLSAPLALTGQNYRTPRKRQFW